MCLGYHGNNLLIDAYMLDICVMYELSIFFAVILLSHIDVIIIHIKFSIQGIALCDCMKRVLALLYYLWFTWHLAHYTNQHINQKHAVSSNTFPDTTVAQLQFAAAQFPLLSQCDTSFLAESLSAFLSVSIVVSV